MCVGLLCVTLLHSVLIFYKVNPNVEDKQRTIGMPISTTVDILHTKRRFDIFCALAN